MRGERPLDYAAVLNALLDHTERVPPAPDRARARASPTARLGGYRDEALKNTSDIEMCLRIARQLHGSGSSRTT